MLIAMNEISLQTAKTAIALKSAYKLKVIHQQAVKSIKNNTQLAQAKKHVSH